VSKKIQYSNELSDKEKEAFVEWSGVLQNKDFYAEKDFGGIKHLILSLYSYIPPLRNDFWNVKIYPTLKDRLSEEPDKKKGNYLIMTDKSAVLTLNHFKTDYTFGQQKITFPVELRKVIKASLKKYPRPCLLWNFCDKTPYSSSRSASASILKQLKDIFDGETNDDMLVKTFICVVA
jgi:hypothetical protein